MPEYLYECQECKHEFTENMRIDDRDIPCREACKICGAHAVLRIIGNNGGFRLGENGSCSWGDGGYGSTHGDIENFKAGRKVYD